MDPKQLLAEAEIRSVLIRERFCRDSGQWQKMRDCYHPDTSLTMIDISWYNGDVDGFIRGSEEMASKGLTGLHTIQPVEITINGPKAFAQSVGTISARFVRGELDYDLMSTCQFLSKLQLIETGEGPSRTAWRMLSIEMIYVQDQIIPVVPDSISRLPGFLPSLATKRKSYGLLSWVLESKGHHINNELPGSDDKGSVERILLNNQQWLLS